MKNNIGLKILTVIFGGLAIMNGFLALLGLLCMILDMCLFFTVPTLIFGIPAIKLARKVGWLKPKAKKEKVVKVKEEIKTDSEQLMFDLKEEKPAVDNVVQFKQKESKQEQPKEEKQNKKQKQTKVNKEKLGLFDKWEASIKEGNWFAIISILLIWLLIIAGGIGLVIAAGALIWFGIELVIGLIGFLFNAAISIIGFIIGIFVIGGFLKFWWSLVIHEHVDKPRGIVRVKVKRRRW